MPLLGSILLDTLAAVVLLIFLVYWYATSEFKFFKNLGVKYVKPVPLFGNFGSVILGRMSFNMAVIPLYEELKKHRYGGVFISRVPSLMICDPELVKQVLTKDFGSVHDRGAIFDEESDPLSANLINIPGARWKNLRSKLNPTFTSGKLKMMFPIIKEVSGVLKTVLEKSAKIGENVDMKDILVRYCTDVIGTCAFGVKCNSLENVDSEFYVMSRKIFKPSIIGSLRFAFAANNKLLARLLPFKWFFAGAHEFFIGLMRETVHYRKLNNVERNDFVNLMMQQQVSDEDKSPSTHPDEVIFTENIMAAQAFIFFIAGLDSIAHAVGFSLYHMSVDPRIQEDLADEVISVLNQHEGELTYEALKEMKLLGRVINESLRMYIPLGFLARSVTVPQYTIPGTTITLKKDSKLMIPVQGLHYDSEIYPDPYKFDPDRFTDEAVSKRHPYAYLPFGEGPRSCIASRFALLECKLCLASLIKDFKFSVSSKTQIPIEFENRSFGTSPKKGFNLKIELRSH